MDFIEETFYRILNSLTNEVRVIENPDEIGFPCSWADINQ